MADQRAAAARRGSKRRNSNSKKKAKPSPFAQPLPPVADWHLNLDVDTAPLPSQKKRSGTRTLPKVSTKAAAAAKKAAATRQSPTSPKSPLGASMPRRASFGLGHEEKNSSRSGDRWAESPLSGADRASSLRTSTSPQKKSTKPGGRHRRSSSLPAVPGAGFLRSPNKATQRGSDVGGDGLHNKVWVPAGPGDWNRGGTYGHEASVGSEPGSLGRDLFKGAGGPSDVVSMKEQLDMQFGRRVDNKKIWDLFGHYDTNSNGLVSFSELKRMLASLGIRERYGSKFVEWAEPYLFGMYFDGVMQLPFERVFDYFLKLHKRWRETNSKDLAGRSPIRPLRPFESADRNHDGVVSMQELNDAAYQLEQQNQSRTRLLREQKRFEQQAANLAHHEEMFRRHEEAMAAAERNEARAQALQARAASLRSQREVQDEEDAKELARKEAQWRADAALRKKERAVERLRLALDRARGSRVCEPLVTALEKVRELGIDQPHVKGEAGAPGSRGSSTSLVVADGSAGIGDAPRLAAEAEALIEEIRAEQAAEGELATTLRKLRVAYESAEQDRLAGPLQNALHTAIAAGADPEAGIAQRCRHLLSTLAQYDAQSAAAAVLEEQIQVSRENRDLVSLREAYDGALAAGLTKVHPAIRVGQHLISELEGDDERLRLGEQELRRVMAVAGPQQDLKSLAAAISRAKEIPGMSRSSVMAEAKELVRTVSDELRDVTAAMAALQQVVASVRKTRDADQLQEAMRVASLTGVRKNSPAMAAARKLHLRLCDDTARAAQLRTHLRELVEGARTALRGDPPLRLKLCQDTAASIREILDDPNLVELLGSASPAVADTRNHVDLLQHEVERIELASLELARVTEECSLSRNLDALEAAIATAEGESGCVPKGAQAMRDALDLKDELMVERRQRLRVLRNLQKAVDRARLALEGVPDAPAGQYFRALRAAENDLGVCLAECVRAKLDNATGSSGGGGNVGNGADAPSGHPAVAAATDTQRALGVALHGVKLLSDELREHISEAEDTREPAPLRAAIERAVAGGVLQAQVQPAMDDETEEGMVGASRAAASLLAELEDEMRGVGPLGELRCAVVAGSSALIATPIGSRAGRVADALEALNKAIAKCCATGVAVSARRMREAKDMRARLVEALEAIDAADSSLERAVIACRQTVENYDVVDDFEAMQLIESSSRALQRELDAALASAVPHTSDAPVASAADTQQGTGTTAESESTSTHTMQSSQAGQTSANVIAAKDLIKRCRHISDAHMLRAELAQTAHDALYIHPDRDPDGRGPAAWAAAATKLEKGIIRLTDASSPLSLAQHKLDIAELQLLLKDLLRLPTEAELLQVMAEHRAALRHIFADTEEGRKQADIAANTAAGKAAVFGQVGPLAESASLPRNSCDEFRGDGAQDEGQSSKEPAVDPATSGSPSSQSAPAIVEKTGNDTAVEATGETAMIGDGGHTEAAKTSDQQDTPSRLRRQRSIDEAVGAGTVDRLNAAHAGVSAALAKALRAGMRHTPAQRNYDGSVPLLPDLMEAAGPVRAAHTLLRDLHVARDTMRDVREILGRRPQVTASDSVLAPWLAEAKDTLQHCNFASLGLDCPEVRQLREIVQTIASDMDARQRLAAREAAQEARQAAKDELAVAEARARELDEALELERQRQRALQRQIEDAMAARVAEAARKRAEAEAKAKAEEEARLKAEAEAKAKAEEEARLKAEEEARLRAEAEAKAKAEEEARLKAEAEAKAKAEEEARLKAEAEAKAAREKKAAEEKARLDKKARDATREAKEAEGHLAAELEQIVSEGPPGTRWSGPLVAFMAENVRNELAEAATAVEAAMSTQEKLHDLRNTYEAVARLAYLGPAAGTAAADKARKVHQPSAVSSPVLAWADALVATIMQQSRDSLRDQVANVMKCRDDLQSSNGNCGIGEPRRAVETLLKEIEMNSGRGNYENGGDGPHAPRTDVTSEELANARALCDEVLDLLMNRSAQLVQSSVRAVRARRWLKKIKDNARKKIGIPADKAMDMSLWVVDTTSDQLVLRRTLQDPTAKEVDGLELIDQQLTAGKAEEDADIAHSSGFKLGAVSLDALAAIVRAKIKLMRPLGERLHGDVLESDPTFYDQFDSLEEKFLVAVERDDVSMVRDCIDRGVDIETLSEEGYNATLLAASLDCVAVVPTLVAAKINLDMVAPNETTATILCAYTGNVDALNAILGACKEAGRSMPDLEVELSNGCTALYLAAQEGCAESCRALVEAKADVHHASGDSVTPLFVAIHEGHTDAVRAVVTDDTLNAQNVHNLTPLYVAMQNEAEDTGELLLSLKADPNIAANDGSTPAEVAIFMGLERSLKALLEANVNPTHARAADGNSLMMLAGYKEQFQMVRDIYAAGGNLAHANSNGQTLRDVIWSLHGKRLSDIGLPDPEGFLIACENNDVETVERCLEAGTDIDSRNVDGLTGIGLACYFKCTDVVRTLVDRRANPNIYSKTGASCLILSVNENHAEVVQLLLDGYDQDGLDQTHTMNHNCSALYLACQEGHHDLVKALLAHSTRAVDICKEGNVSPLYISAHEGHEKCVRYLVDAKARVDIRNDRGATPLYIACQKNHTPICRTLLDADADANIVTLANSSPLAVAVFHFNPKIVAMLLSHGADIDVGAQDGTTEAMLAAHSLDVDILCQLILHGASLNIQNDVGMSVDNILRTTHGVCVLDVALYCLHMSAGVRQDAQSIKHLFTSIDENGDEEITLAELKDGLAKWGLQSKFGEGFDQFVTDEFNKINQDGDDAVSFKEFRATFSRFQREHRELLALSSGTGEDLETMQRLFNRIDVNNDGEITQDELKEALISWGLKTKYGNGFDKFAAAEFDRLNQNGDHAVNFGEFRACFSRFHLLYRSSEDYANQASDGSTAEAASTLPEEVPDWLRKAANAATTTVWGAIQSQKTIAAVQPLPDWRTYLLNERFDHADSDNASALEHLLGFEVEEVSGWADPAAVLSDSERKQRRQGVGEGVMAPPPVPLKGETYLRVCKVDETTRGRRKGTVDHIEVGDILMSFFGCDSKLLHSRDVFVELIEHLPVCHLEVFRPIV